MAETQTDTTQGMTAREQLEAVRRALREGREVSALALLDQVLDGKDRELPVSSDIAVSQRPQTLRLAFDVTPRRYESPSRPVDTGAPPVWGLDVVARDPGGVALARGRATTLGEALKSVGRALQGDERVTESLLRAQAASERAGGRS